VSNPRPFLLDTNIAGYIVNGRSPEARRILDETIPLTPVLISSVTEAEILYGLEWRPGAIRVRRAVEKLFQVVEIRPWGSAEAQAYSRLRASLRAAGKNLSHPDLMIAAHALSLDAVLISHDKAFRNVVPHLAILDWATDIV
jgi:tRNA(fMet)-specific endonuclease VapC